MVQIFNQDDKELEWFVTLRKPSFASVSGLLKGEVVVFIDEDDKEYAFNGKIVGAVTVEPIKEVE